MDWTKGSSLFLFLFICTPIAKGSCRSNLLKVSPEARYCSSYKLKLTGELNSSSKGTLGSGQVMTNQHLFFSNNMSLHTSLYVDRDSESMNQTNKLRKDFLFFQLGSIQENGLAIGMGSLLIPFGFRNNHVISSISKKALRRVITGQGNGFGFAFSNQQDKLLEIFFQQVEESYAYRNGSNVLSNTISLRYTKDTSLLFQTKVGLSIYLSENEARAVALGLLNFNEAGKETLLEFRRVHFISGNTRFQQSFTIGIKEEWKKNSRNRFLYYDQRDHIRQFSVWRDSATNLKRNLILSYGLKYRKTETPVDKGFHFSLLAGLEYID